MKIGFYGAARTVTGSKHLLTLDNGIKILLDCGMFQGMGHVTESLNAHFAFDPLEVDYMILSHAHIDHCGLLPRLVGEGFKGPVFCTPATMDLARVLMLDSAKIQAQDSQFSHKHLQAGDEPEEPLYTEEDVMQTVGRMKIVPYGETYAIDEHISLQFTDAGHILGSAAVHLTLKEHGKETRLTFSGDVGRYDDMLLKSPAPFRQADYIIMESTYGDSLHQAAEPIEQQLYEIIQHTCIVKKGKLIIPAFSVGRTQELLYALNALELKHRLPEVNYYVDSPLSAEATAVLKHHTEVYNAEVKKTLAVDHDIFSFKGLRFIESKEESKMLNNDPRPCVIISSSGMAEGGRVRHHIRNNIGDSRNTILMVGYCEPSSLGGRLTAGEKEVMIFNAYHQVNAEIKSMRSLSAHGDYKDLLRFLSCQDPAAVKQLFLVHGEYHVQQQFRQYLEEQGFRKVMIPVFREEMEL